MLLFSLALVWLLCVIPWMEYRWEGSWLLGLAVFDVSLLCVLFTNMP
jgi:hypothetical protein